MKNNLLAFEISLTINCESTWPGLSVYVFVLYVKCWFALTFAFVRKHIPKPFVSMEIYISMIFSVQETACVTFQRI